jgi:hypothetical protein
MLRATVAVGVCSMPCVAHIVVQLVDSMLADVAHHERTVRSVARPRRRVPAPRDRWRAAAHAHGTTGVLRCVVGGRSRAGCHVIASQWAGLAPPPRAPSVRFANAGGAAAVR